MAEQFYTYKFPIYPTADQRLHFLRRRLDTYEKEDRYMFWETSKLQS
jgi:hypothetical protein